MALAAAFFAGAAATGRWNGCTWDNGCCKRHWRSAACMFGGALPLLSSNNRTSGAPRNRTKGVGRLIRKAKQDGVGHFWGVSRMWSVLAALDDLENYTLVDVGAGDGSIGAIARQKYALGAVRAYDVQLVNNSWVDLALFDGKRLPEADGSADLVMFAYVLHHAAASTPGLLREAARVARRWVLVSEDLDRPEWRARNAYHDLHAVFRSEDTWREQFASAGLRVVASGPIFDKDHPCHYFLLRRLDAPRHWTPANGRAQAGAFSKLMHHGLERGLGQGQISVSR
jgi:SAM-dependent methyltransferase